MPEAGAGGVTGPEGVMIGLFDTLLGDRGPRHYTVILRHHLLWFALHRNLLRSEMKDDIYYEVPFHLNNTGPRRGGGFRLHVLPAL